MTCTTYCPRAPHCKHLNAIFRYPAYLLIVPSFLWPDWCNDVHAVRRRHLFRGLVWKLLQLWRGHIQWIPSVLVQEVRSWLRNCHYCELELLFVSRWQEVACWRVDVPGLPPRLRQLRGRRELHRLRRGQLRGHQRLFFVHCLCSRLLRTAGSDEHLHAMRARNCARRHRPGQLCGLCSWQICERVRDHFLHRLPRCSVQLRRVSHLYAVR